MMGILNLVMCIRNRVIRTPTLVIRILTLVMGIQTLEMGTQIDLGEGLWIELHGVDVLTTLTPPQ